MDTTPFPDAMLIDIHTHLPVDDDLSYVEQLYTPDLGCHPNTSCLYFLNIEPEMFFADLQLPQQFRLSSGIHPWQADKNIDPAILEAILSNPAIRLIGEIGLDKKAAVDCEVQTRVFELQLTIASACHKPVLIHNVGSMAEILACKHKFLEIPAWIIHGFRGRKIQVLQWIEQGCYLSFGLHYNDEALQACPAENLLLETDASAESIELIYSRAAQTRGWSVAALENQLEKNLYDLFKQ